MADPSVLGEIPLYKLMNNWQTIPVLALDDETFIISTNHGKIVLKDEELKKDTEGRYIIDLKPLDLKGLLPNIEVPETFEFPLDVLAARKEKRRLKALSKEALSITEYQGKLMYFYMEGDKLRILHGEKGITADKIEIIYGKKAVNVEGLDLGHTYFELPVNVAVAFEKVLSGKELKNLALVMKGKSLLNGKEYYGFNMEIPSEKWAQVKGYFEDFGEKDELTGWLTSYPTRVAEILHIPIKRRV